MAADIPAVSELPIEPTLPQIRHALGAGRSAVLQAPPGAGKTTRVPLALLDEPWLGSGKIVMLEPRRLAARAAARRMAATLGERVGETVGYRVRLDTRVGPRTRIEVVTEGVLTRMLQSDPSLEGVGLVIFDEFHERSLHADLGLALCLQARDLLRPELRVLVMSATLAAEPVARLLGDAPVLTSLGRSFPVAVRYLEHRREGPIEPLVATTVTRALEAQSGDVLVFLPGVGEIRRTEERLASAGLGAGIRITPLFGDLAPEAQDRAIRPSPPGERKVVLATAIAETSLTIEGVRVVVDSGLARTPRFSPRTGMTRLETVPVPRSSAEQRCGRAGRTEPGVCFRLWTEPEQAALLPHATPEILEADLAPLALELAAWGIRDPAELPWLDPPPAAAYAQARELLRELGALGPDGMVTAHGRKMAELATHPRLAHLVLGARELGHGAVACDLAALLGERDPLRGAGEPADADLRLRLDLLRGATRGGGRVPASVQGFAVDRGTVQRVLAEAREWRGTLGVAAEPYDSEAAGLLLAFAYPDRIAQRRPGSLPGSGGRFLLRNGRGAVLPTVQALGEAPYLVAAELDDRGRESRIWLAAPVTLADLQTHCADQIEREAVVEWDPDAGTVQARRRERLGALVLRDAPLPDPDPEAVTAALLRGVSQAGPSVLPWTRAARQLQERLIFLHRLQPDRWPDLSDAALAATLDLWLRPRMHGLRRLDELARLDLAAVLQEQLSWDTRVALDRLAPTHWTVPSGSRIPIDYSDPDAPVLAVRLQEVFGLQDTPRVAEGAVPLTLHLLSPAGRPVQVTRDLVNFWRNTYFEVRRDLKGRYPKHHWPDDPLQATPTHRAKPRP